MALDGKSGQTLTTAAPHSFMVLHASATRVYVGRWTELAVHSADDGKLIGTIGWRAPSPRTGRSR